MIKKLLVIGIVWPEPKSSAAGSRMIQLIELFIKEEYQIIFATTTSKTANAYNLKSLGVEEKQIELNSSSFDDFIETFQPHVVLFDRFMTEEQFGWRIAEKCPKALRILDTEDLHSLRKGRQQAFKDNKAFDASYLFNDTAKREIASIYRSDISLIISETEMDILINQFKVDESLLLYLPFMLDKITDEMISILPEFKRRAHFITIGNFLHEPNYNAILYLKEAIWPLVRKKLTNAELHIYGAYASQKVNQLHNEKEGFLIKGFAEDVNQVMQEVKVCLAPIRFGAGLKGKLIDAIKNGTPCVTTTIGAEGMFGNLEPNSFIEDNPKEFANKAIQLYQDENIWKVKQGNGFEIINKRFNKEKFQEKFISTIKKAERYLNKNRLNNFTGQILQHHTLQSTKYMSKWIEEKNKC